MKTSRGIFLHGAGLVSLAGYGILATQAGAAEARPWLVGATLLGWLAMGAVIWRGHDPGRQMRGVIWWAVLFRLVGIGVEPSWEDDYHRYLWDGYQTRLTGDPYAQAPAEFFGGDEAMPLPVVEALDQINHPEIPTIYGPVAQLIFWLGSWLGPGRLWVLKLILVLLELSGWWALSRVVGARTGLFLWWCPLAVTEVAFAGHVDAVGVAGLAWAVAAWQRNDRVMTTAGAVWAMGVKFFGVILLPFVVSRYGWRWGAMGGGLFGLICLPFLMQGSDVGLTGLTAMGATFEYNSTGYAVLQWVMSPEAARMVSGILIVSFAAIAWWGWSRDQKNMAPPVAAILGMALWWSPVFNPWYALWLLPLWTLRPSAWVVGVMLAVSLTYAHGWGEGTHAVVDYGHPWWLRPLEVGVVVATVLIWRWWRGRPARRLKRVQN